LTYPGLLTSVTSLNDINLVNTGSAVDERMVLTATTITTPVYFSFIMKVKAVPAASTRLASLRGTTNGSGILAPNVKIAPSGSNYQITVDGGSGTPQSTADMSINNSVLVVVKYTSSAAANGGTTDMWINPAASALGSATDPTPTFSGITGGVLLNVTGFSFRTGLGVVNADVDELRIGATWADVTPQGGDPVDLSITKSIDNSTPEVGSTVNFTLTASNGGYNTATSVSVTDILPSGYTFVSATLSVGSWSSPTWSVGTLASAANATLTITATVNASGDFKNKAYFSKDASDTKQSNDTASVTPSSVGASLPFYEPFNESVGSFSGTSIRNWIAATTNANVVASPLAYTGLWTTPNSNSVSYGGNISETVASQKIGFTQQTLGTVYASSIIKVTSLPDATSFMYKYNFSFYNAAGTYAGCVNLFPDPADPTNKFFIGVCKKNNNSYTGSAPYTTANSAITWSAASYTINTPILLVMGYDLTTAGEVMNLWINPDQSTFGAGSAPTATLSDAVTASTLTTGKNIIGFLFRSGAVSPGMNMDELRIGTSWADVTPQTPTFSSIGSGSGTWSDASEWTGNVVPVSGANVIVSNALSIDQNVAVNSITVNSGAKLTLNSGSNLLTGTFNINSDGTNGTGTFVDLGTTTVIGTSTVNQYISSTATGLTGRNWYISSPLSAAVSSTITTATVNGLVFYNGTSWLAAGTTMDVMKGYIAKSPAQNTTIAFAGGTLNSGNKSVSNLPLGFNLVGNPYPSFVNWTDATKTNVSTSIWYRSKSTGSYLFQTYNVAGEGISVNNGTDIIPPMQSFWIKTTNATNSLGFTNDMRSHQDQSVATNRLKAPKVSSQQLLRLQVSNGINSDEAVVYFNENAQSNLDEYDSQKMFNDIADVPEIYTIIGSEKLVINGLQPIVSDVEIPLGFTTGQTNTFVIRAKEILNFAPNTQVILKDKLLNKTADLTVDIAYTFDAETSSTDRFAVLFKAPTLATGTIDAESTQANVRIFKNSINQISIVNSNLISEGTITICNAVGQKILNCSTTGSTTVVGKSLISGVYLVTIDINGNRTTKKVIIN
jgi:uncharacterized repeat protein (TIGR01451 family)